MRRALLAGALHLAGAAALAGAQGPVRRDTLPALKTLFAGDFRVGVALAPRQFDGTDKRSAALVTRQFNAISPENVLKWEVVHPRPVVFDFREADRYVAFGRRNGMFILGHTLVWHSQTPKWVFEDSTGAPLSRDALLDRMRDHIRRVVGRYRGRIGGWDVVNEALEEDGTLRQSPWRRIIGEDYVAKAFEYAHEADPKAELYYNDYNLELPLKRAGAVNLVKALQARGIHVAAVGVQAHHKLGTFPTFGAEDSTIAAFAALGVHVNLSELDVDVLPAATRNRTADVGLRAGSDPRLNPYPGALPDSVEQQLASRYAGMFAIYVKHRDVIDRVTFWGLSDRDSWLNDWPVRGRTSHPLLFDRALAPKPAFDSVVAVARRLRTTLMP